MMSHQLLLTLHWLSLRPHAKKKAQGAGREEAWRRLGSSQELFTWWV
jgi:hypothetical protein